MKSMKAMKAKTAMKPTARKRQNKAKLVPTKPKAKTAGKQSKRVAAPLRSEPPACVARPWHGNDE